MKQYYRENKKIYLDKARDWAGKNQEKAAKAKKEYRERNEEEIRGRNAQAYHEQKVECFLHYGGGTIGCRACGESETEFLTLDHVNGGGKKHSRAIGNNIYSWASKNRFPSGFQVLCRNCNQEKGGTDNAPESKHESRRETKNIVFSHYSGGRPRCRCCGIEKMAVLCLDHLVDGSKHRKETGIKGGHRMYRWCIRNTFPPLFQVLCQNCNWSKRTGLECAHGRRKPRAHPVIPLSLPDVSPIFAARH